MPHPDSFRSIAPAIAASIPAEIGFERLKQTGVEAANHLHAHLCLVLHLSMVAVFGVIALLLVTAGHFSAVVLLAATTLLLGSGSILGERSAGNGERKRAKHGLEQHVISP
jgi:hypothetical protein